MEKLEKRGFEFHIHHWPNGYDLYSLLILYLYLYELHLSVALSMCVSCSVVSDSLRHHGLWPAKLLYPWNSPGKNTEVGCHYLLQGIFPTQELSPPKVECVLVLMCQGPSLCSLFFQTSRAWRALLGSCTHLFKIFICLFFCARSYLQRVGSSVVACGI